MTDQEDTPYPPQTVLYKDTGFQGYEPEVKETCQAKKKATWRGTHGRREAKEPEVGRCSSQRGACIVGGETLPPREECLPENQKGGFGFSLGTRGGNDQYP